MGTEIEVIEARLKSFVEQLEVERGIFERIMYKNKNQHRRSPYFQYLQKVRRDLRLLQSVKLEGLVDSCFQVITGKKPKAKVHLLESLKWRKCDCGTPNFMERLLGAARLLSQMVEPILKAASKVAALLAQTFFMAFSTTVLALLGRLRILIQQVLLDIVSIFNMVSSLSQMKQSVKINQKGVEVFRECYPWNKEFVILECLWKTDKFELLETIRKNDTKDPDGGDGDVSIEPSVLRYEVMESFLGDDDAEFEKAYKEYAAEKVSTRPREDEKHLFCEPSIGSEHREPIDGSVKVGVNLVVASSPDERLPPKSNLSATASSSPSSKMLAPKSSEGTVAFDSVKRPEPWTPAFVSIKRPAPSTPAFVSVKRPATANVGVGDPLKESSKDINDEG
ncbi:hypothetical protein Tsubulata_003309 [Turnera subulata]|uniref:Nucleolus and neural progenitor protein-like N-terminal domain-containing protein n=1 Tax=Turnera subulata TaxID=218843 RepID=A0A9Q0F9K2_9ROSI|nr:hypothetical protein Tsubulata_003309 [Turnera subulata]